LTEERPADYHPHVNLKLALKALSLFWMARTFALGPRGSHGPPSARPTKEDLRLQFVQGISDLIDAWFPRSLDREYGGFLCDFDSDWEPHGPQQKRLEFQARQAKAAALAAMFDRKHRHAYDAAEHGFRYLTEIMWDKKYGGWLYMLHRNGKPIYKEKHLHGVAYAIQACVAYYQLTGKAAGLEFANAGFHWLDSHARDSANGGYYSYLTEDGTPITSLASCDNPIDPIGAPIGLKDCNVTLDILESLATLYRATSDSHVGGRLTELLEIVRDFMFRPPGTLIKYYTPDWKPASDLIEIGVGLQGSCALIKASSLMPTALRSEVFDIAQAIVDGCLRYVWDSNDAGFYYEAAVNDGTVTVRDRKKSWWVQAEGIRALLTLTFENCERSTEYFDEFLCLWNFIDMKLIDHRRKGWHQVASLPHSAKAYVWKDASHEMRALIECAQMLQGAD
jgi:mannobiose 2-epimerase